jgi:hypothetical protein
MTLFSPQSWRDSASRLDRASQDFQAASDPALTPPGVSGGPSPVDASLRSRTEPLTKEWYFLIGGASIKLGSDASKMRATAANYAETEENNTALATRYWSH